MASLIQKMLCNWLQLQISYTNIYSSQIDYERRKIQLGEKNSFGDAVLKMHIFPQFSKTHYWTVITPLKTRKPARWQGLSFLMKFPVQLYFHRTVKSCIPSKSYWFLVFNFQRFTFCSLETWDFCFQGDIMKKLSRDSSSGQQSGRRHQHRMIHIICVISH